MPKPSKNSGESGELLVKAKLLKMMLNGEKFLDGSEIKKINAGDFKSDDGCYAYNQKIDDTLINKVCESGAEYDYPRIRDILLPLDIVKAGSKMKADVSINDISYSIKSSAVRPAIINHTFREGFSVAARYANADLNLLDTEISRYWENRCQGIIGEDVNGSRRKEFNLFWSSKFKEGFRPIFNYFAFEGTGAGLSPMPAKYILEFDDPLNPKTWKIIDKDNFYNVCWDNLVFSVRHHGKKIETDSTLSDENKMWARKINGKLRGRLHVRTN
jgi:hypothetical protein